MSRSSILPPAVAQLFQRTLAASPTYLGKHRSPIMSNPAQEEADRLFNHKHSAPSHPEDRDADHSSSEDEKPRTRIIRSSRGQEATADDADADTDSDHADTMATTTTTNTYTVPSTVHYANTGPKGVIADAQNYHRARKSTFRRTLTSISDSLSFGGQRRTSPPREKPSRKDGNTSGSDLDDSDDDFMAQWRQQRLAELQSQFSEPQQRRTSPSRRTWGTLEHVSANGYLAAVEDTAAQTHVVVLLHDPLSAQSREVEDELKLIAYRWNQVRFVRMLAEVAEMETVEIPAILCYRGGDVFVTMSGVDVDGLEEVLRKQGVLQR